MSLSSGGDAPSVHGAASSVANGGWAPTQYALSPSHRLMRLLWPGALAAQAVSVAARLGLADHLDDGPRSVAALAAATSVHEASLGRLLRALVSLGVFTEPNPGIFDQSVLSDALRTDHPQSIRNRATMLGAGFVWKAVGELEAAVRTGDPAFDDAFGLPFFSYLSGHAEDAAVFNAGISLRPDWLQAVANAYDFGRFERLVDVGGGHGTLMMAILTAHGRVHGVVQDVASVIATAPPPPVHVASRVDMVSANFFASVPVGADGYLLSHVLHDWDDAHALRLLRNCRTAIRHDGRLLVIDTVVTSAADPSRALMDVLMMVLTGGRERTEAEFRSLLGEAGFALTQVMPTAAGAILEARPI